MNTEEKEARRDQLQALNYFAMAAVLACTSVFLLTHQTPAQRAQTAKEIICDAAIPACGAEQMVKLAEKGAGRLLGGAK